MRYSFIPILLTVLFIFGCSSTVDIPKQTKVPRPPSRVENEGVYTAMEYNNEGKYDSAETVYEQVLKLNPDNIDALHEISLVLWRQKKLNKCLEYTLKGSEYESPYVAEFYLLAANVLDYTGEPDNASRFYQETFNLEPSNSLFYYQAGLARYRINKYDDAERYFSQTIILNPQYSLGYFALAEINLIKQEEMRAYLLAHKFLMIESDTVKLKSALEMLDYIREISVAKKGENAFNINLGDISLSSPYFGIEMEFKLTQAVRKAEKKDGKSEIYITRAELDTVLSAVNESPKPDGDIDAYLFDYFSKLKSSDNAEAFIYYVYQQSKLPGAAEWIENNQSKIDALLAWDKSYVYKFTK